jgi:hypothetical protein
MSCGRSAQAVTACRRVGGSIDQRRCRSPERPAGSMALPNNDTLGERLRLYEENFHA